MRLFIALAISEEIKDYFTKIEEDIRIITKDVCLVEPKNVHLTLKFLGEVPEHDQKPIIEKLKGINHQKINLETDGIGFFPNNKNPKVLWVGLKNQKSIIELHKKIDLALGTDFPNEFDFSTHITLGRIPNQLTKTEIEKIQQLKIEGKTCQITEFHLMKSDLTPRRSIYSIVGSFSLND